MANATKPAPTSNHQRLIVGLGLSINQAAAIYRAADETGKRQQVDDIAQACEHFAQSIKDAARAKLLAMVSDQPASANVDASALLAALDLDGMPGLPPDTPVTTTKQPARKPRPSQTSTATVAGERVYCTSQPPVNPSTKRRILWADSAQRIDNGKTYVNVGNGRGRTIGATIEDWRALLIDHRDELLSTLEALHNEASQA